MEKGRKFYANQNQFIIVKLYIFAHGHILKGKETREEAISFIQNTGKMNRVLS